MAMDAADATILIDAMKADPDLMKAVATALKGDTDFLQAVGLAAYTEMEPVLDLMADVLEGAADRLQRTETKVTDIDRKVGAAPAPTAPPAPPTPGGPTPPSTPPAPGAPNALQQKLERVRQKMRGGRGPAPAPTPTP